MIENLNGVLENAFIELFFPTLFKLVPSQLIGYDVHVKHAKEVKEMISQTIEEHKKSKQTNPRDFIDVFLQEKNSKYFTENHLIGVCLDFFEAGGETVGSTLSWVLLYLSLYPKEQETCQAEIDSCDKISLADKVHLPKCQAFLWEVQRISNVAPAGLEHRALKDVEFYGFTIPKGKQKYFVIQYILGRDLREILRTVL